MAVPLVLEATAAQSIVDVGCGLGAWLAVFKEHGIDDVLGYDGPWVDRAQLLVVEDEYEVADLAAPLVSERRFDLALCLEVAHILDEEVGPQLVDSLTSLADIVLFGAAIPGQGGLHHMNEQWPRYWAELFARRGYLATDPFRAALWEHPDVKWWFAQNTVCFATPDALARTPVLAAARCSDAPLPLVHPGCLLSYADALAAAQAESAQQSDAQPSRWRRRRAG